jgi:hypothetical protein
MAQTQSAADPLEAIRLSDAHKVTRGSKEVTVALLSSSVNCRLPALRDGIDRLSEEDRRFDACETIEGVNSQDLTHGTFSASVILQIAPGIRVLPIRIFGPNGTGSYLDMARGMQIALDQGADIIAIGGGGSPAPDSMNALCSLVEEARMRNVSVVAPAGNSAEEITTDKPFILASCKNDTLFSVAGLSSKLDELAKFSNYSSYFVQLAAPSAGIKGLDATGKPTQFQGTTVSYLLATGVLALRRSTYANESVEARREALLGAVTPLESLVGKVESAGIIDAAQAVGN